MQVGLCLIFIIVAVAEGFLEGDHEYTDVVIHCKFCNTGVSERSIIDIDFRNHFEIAPAVKFYDRCIREVFLGVFFTLHRTVGYLS